MKLKHILLPVITLAMTHLSLNIQAEVISQRASFERYERTCPGLADSNYITNYSGGISLIMGVEIEDITVEDACIFNSRFQQAFYNFDGTNKSGDHTIPPFTADQIGTAGFTDQAFGTDSVLVADVDGDYFGNIYNDEENLSLPVFKILTKSNALERNSINGFASTEYLWTGEDTTLSFDSTFDFFASDGEWALPGAVTIDDYLLNYVIGVSGTLTTEPGFVITFSEDTDSKQFRSDEATFEVGPDLVFEHTMSIAFDVTAGQRFHLWGQIQGFGYNGGYIDGSNTFTTALVVEGLDQATSNERFATALVVTPAPLAEINSPGLTALFFISVGLLMFARKRLPTAKLI